VAEILFFNKVISAAARRIRKRIPHNTSVVTSPPGNVNFKYSGPLVLVASEMRSGTHVLIDSLLNNFGNLRNNPLYINLDEYVAQHREVGDLLNRGAYIIKTHYPQVYNQELASAVELITASAKIIVINRDESQTLKSYLSFVETASLSEWAPAHEKFKHYWKGISTLNVEFSELTSYQKYPIVIDKIQKYIELPRSKNLIRPPTENQILRAYFSKLMTRVFGRYAHRINTTITLWNNKTKSR